MSLDRLGHRFADGNHYGPVLTRTDMLLLQPEIELHPILAGFERETFMFNIVSGQSEMINLASGELLSFPERRHFATLPRVEELVIIVKSNPFCCVVKNRTGVTVENVIAELYDCYRQPLTPDEEKSIPEWIKATMRRQRARVQDLDPRASDDVFYRRDLFRGAFQFDSLEREETYTKQRLGFTMPNVFVLRMQD